MKLGIGVVALLTLLGLSLWAQQSAGNTKISLKDGEKCQEGQSCTCVNVDVKVGCECKITLGSGSQHCPLDLGGGPKPLTGWVVPGVIGAALGAALTFALMRRRA